MNNFEVFCDNNKIKEGDVIKLTPLTDDLKEKEVSYLLKISNLKSFENELQRLIGVCEFIEDDNDVLYVRNMLLYDTYSISKADILNIG